MHLRKQRVVIGMSGGVDSSTAAALLLEQGYDVVGITLKLWPQDCLSRAEDKCCGPQAVTDARAVCHRLGIPFYLVDEADAFDRHVVQYFADEYRAGRTPNPCVLCNEKLKFGTLLERARHLGADKVATGHYARIRQDPQTGRWQLLRGRDRRKDQSYFLFSLRQEQLAAMLMPLGDYCKDDTRAVARNHQLRTAEKEESMEICFVPDGDYGKFLRQSGKVQPHRGEIVDLAGRVLGHHDGIEFFTIGQRRGIRIASTHPYYVVALEPETNRVVVGEDAALICDRFEVDRCNWIAWAEPPPEIQATVKIRYNHPGAPATILPQGNQAEIRLEVPQRAVTPGQACVFYQEDMVIGGGWIRRTSAGSASRTT